MTGIISDNIGRSSGLVKAASGGGGITWQSVTTGSTLTAESGKGYPINSTSNACTVTLPASPSVGDEIALLDYAGTADTNKITMSCIIYIYIYYISIYYTVPGTYILLTL